MTEPSTIIILDPDEAKVGRVRGTEFEDGLDRVMHTWVARGLADLDGEDLRVQIAVQPEPFMSFVVAVLSALGFPEGDLEYLADRFTKEFK